MSYELVCRLHALEAGALEMSEVVDLASDVLLSDDGERELGAEAAVELAGFDVDGSVRCITTSVGVVYY
jgi:hypothetical protein